MPHIWGYAINATITVHDIRFVSVFTINNKVPASSEYCVIV